MDQTANPTPIDTQRTLAYGHNVFVKKILWLPVLALVLSLGYLMYSGEPLNRYWQPWVGLIGGAIAILYAFYQLMVPPLPMLVLSPEGLVYRNVSENLIPWQEIGDISVQDHSIRHRGWTHTFKDVTVIWLSAAFFDDRIRVYSLIARGPYWSNNIIRGEKLVGIVISHELLSLAADPLHQEIRGRWNAFKERPRAPLPPRARERRAANLRWEGIQYGVLFGLFVIVVAAALFVDYFEPFARRDEVPVAIWQQPAEPRSVFETKSAEQQWGEMARRRKFPFSDDSNMKQGSVPLQPPGGAYGHTDAVTALAVLRDGKTFLSGSVDHTIKLWDALSTSVLRDAAVHGGIVRAVHLLPDGAHMLSADDDGKLVLRTLIDGRVVHVFDPGLRYGNNGTFAVSADGRRALGVYPSGANIVWDLEKRSMVKNLSGVGMGTGALSADGSLAITGGYDGALWLWDVDAGSILRSVGYHQHGAHAVAFMPDGVHAISSGADFAVRLWEVASGAEVRAFTGHKGLVNEIAVSADGKRLLSGSQYDGTARLWDVETGAEIASIALAGRVSAVAFLSDNEILVADGRHIKLWKPTGQLVRIYAGRGN